MTDQLDRYRHSPARQAEAWRAAAESSKRQFPDNHERYRYYAGEAERIERQEKSA